MEKYKLPLLSQFSIVSATLIIIISMQPWFSWGKPYMSIFLMIFLISSLLLIVKRKTILSRNQYIYPIIFLFVWYLWYGLYRSSKVEVLEPFTLFFTQILPLFIVYNYTILEKRRLKEYVLKVFAFILLLSLLFYVLFLLGFPLKYDILEHPINNVYGNFANFYFFIVEGSFDASDFLRFRSIFTEPGHLGMMCALFLYISEYNIKKWYNVIILLSLLLSFSFAAYVLLVLGWFIYLWAVRKSIKYSILILGIFALVSCIVDVYTAHNGSEGIVSTLIFDRAKYDKDKGIAGNNRNDITFETYYEKFSTRGEYYIGVGIDEYKSLFAGTPNSSYRTFIVQYGILGMIIFLILYFSFCICQPSRLAFGMFLLFLASFLQRPYWYWFAQSLMYIVTVAIFYSDKRMQKTKI